MPGLRTAHIELEVACLIPGLGLDAPNVLTLAFDRGTLTVETVTLSTVALNEVFDVEVRWTFSRGPGAKLG